MKLSVTISKEEKNETENVILKDPCAHIECGEIDCEACPLHKTAVALRKAQDDFMNTLHSITEE
jgi:hypothetical protein